MHEEKNSLRNSISSTNLLWYLKTADFALDKGMYESLMQRMCMYFNTSDSCLLDYISEVMIYL